MDNHHKTIVRERKIQQSYAYSIVILVAGDIRYRVRPMRAIITRKHL